MPDIVRKHSDPQHPSFHHVHTHVCPNCKRSYSCNCEKQREQTTLVCRDCETAPDMRDMRRD